MSLKFEALESGFSHTNYCKLCQLPCTMSITVNYTNLQIDSSNQF